MQNTISERTTRRTLKQMGYSSRRPHRVPLLSAKNRKQRLQFAQAHQNWTIEDWKNIAWSDESQFHQRDSANPSFHHNFSFQLGSSTITPSKTARNLGVVIDDKLNFTDHITKTARSCRFALYNIKKIWIIIFALSLRTCNTTPCSGSCSVQTWLLQFSLGRSLSQFHQTSTIKPK